MLAVTIPTINCLRYLKLVIGSLPHAGELVIVIDQASTDGTGAWLAEQEDLLTLTQTRNIGVAPAWNLGLVSAFAAGATHVAVLNHDIILAPGALERLMGWVDAGLALATLKPVPEMLPWIQPEIGIDPTAWEGTRLRPWLSRPGDFCGFMVTRRAVDAIGWFDERYRVAYCVVPETPVLTEDLRWCPIGELRVGDWLIGVDEHPTQEAAGLYRRRSYRKSQVLSSKKRLTRCLRITLADGREVICSRDHKWLTKYPVPCNTPFRWRPAERLLPGHRISTPLDPWTSAGTWEEGWLAAICDGEANMRMTADNMCLIAIAQKEGVVLDQIIAMLDHFSLPYRVFSPKRDGVARVTIGVRRHVLRLLGQMRPVRFLQKLEIDGLSTFSRSAAAAMPIVTIEDAGEREVVSIETSTKTYLANGMVAHNCEDLDYEMRLIAAGLHHGMCHDALAFHYVSRAIYEGGVNNGDAFRSNCAYFETKWGMHHEVARRLIAAMGPPRLHPVSIESA